MKKRSGSRQCSSVFGKLSDTFDEIPIPDQTELLLLLVSKADSTTLKALLSAIEPRLKMDLLSLPLEISYAILDYLDLKSLGKCLQVCRGWVTRSAKNKKRILCLKVKELSLPFGRKEVLLPNGFYLKISLLKSGNHSLKCIIKHD